MYHFTINFRSVVPSQAAACKIFGIFLQKELKFETSLKKKVDERVEEVDKKVQGYFDTFKKVIDENEKDGISFEIMYKALDDLTLKPPNFKDWIKIFKTSNFWNFNPKPKILGFG